MNIQSHDIVANVTTTRDDTGAYLELNAGRGVGKHLKDNLFGDAV